VEKECILKIEHPLSSIDGACKVGKMIIVEKVSIYETPIFKGVVIKNAPKRFNISRLAEKSNGLKLDINSILKL
jgi:hypothetical protein